MASSLHFTPEDSESRQYIPSKENPVSSFPKLPHVEAVI